MKLTCFTRKLQLHTLPRDPPVHCLEITGGRDRIIKGKVSTYTLGAKMLTVNACQSSSGKWSDWISDKTPDLENRLVRGWTHQKPGKLGKLIV